MVPNRCWLSIVLVVLLTVSNIIKFCRQPLIVKREGGNHQQIYYEKARANNKNVRFDSSSTVAIVVRGVKDEIIEGEVKRVEPRKSIEAVKQQQKQRLKATRIETPQLTAKVEELGGSTMQGKSIETEMDNKQQPQSQAVKETPSSKENKGPPQSQQVVEVVEVGQSILLPPQMDLLRRNTSLAAVYKISNRRLKRDCSCRNPKAKEDCCERFFRVTHKMGYSMTNKLFGNYSQVQVSSDLSRRSDSDFPPPNVDYRDVLIFRDIYAALKSGYLYHLTGRECWLNSESQKMKSPGRLQAIYWKSFHVQNFVALDLPPSPDGRKKRSLCTILQQLDEKAGMRVYIDFVFHAYYNDSFAHWALSQTFPEVRKRTMYACYDDFLSPSKDVETIESTLSFLFNKRRKWNGSRPGETEYIGGHSTSHEADPTQVERLLRIIRELDQEVFHNEIAWVNSVLPCQHAKTS